MLLPKRLSQIDAIVKLFEFTVSLFQHLFRTGWGETAARRSTFGHLHTLHNSRGSLHLVVYVVEFAQNLICQLRSVVSGTQISDDLASLGQRTLRHL